MKVKLSEKLGVTMIINQPQKLNSNSMKKLQLL